MKNSTAFSGKNVLELGVELGGERLVVGEMIVGLPMFLMTLATVNVLPVPVAPRSVWYGVAAEDALGQLLDGARLVAHRREAGGELEGRVELLDRGHQGRASRRRAAGKPSAAG